MQYYKWAKNLDLKYEYLVVQEMTVFVTQLIIKYRMFYRSGELEECEDLVETQQWLQQDGGGSHNVTMASLKAELEWTPHMPEQKLLDFFLRGCRNPCSMAALKAAITVSSDPPVGMCSLYQQSSITLLFLVLDLCTLILYPKF